MKGNIIILLLILLTQNTGYCQTIKFNKDSLKIEGEGFYEDIKDSLFIKNSGINELVIDSIYTNNIYSYPVEVCTKDTVYFFCSIFDQHPSALTISPQDSIKLIFFMPDLCPICDGSSISNFEDTLYFRSNAVNNPTYLIYVSGQGTTDVKDNYSFPDKYSLEQNYPNPFNPSTKIIYSLKQSAHITLEVFDILGRSVQILFEGLKNIGEHEIIFSGKDLASGIYYYQLRTAGKISTKKMLLIK